MRPYLKSRGYPLCKLATRLVYMYKLVHKLIDYQEAPIQYRPPLPYYGTRHRNLLDLNPFQCRTSKFHSFQGHHPVGIASQQTLLQPHLLYHLNTPLLNVNCCIYDVTVF